MFMFKTADPTRRTPAVLQAYTKENLVFQLAAFTVFVCAWTLKDKIEERRLTQRWNKIAKNLDKK